MTDSLSKNDSKACARCQLAHLFQLAPNTGVLPDPPFLKYYEDTWMYDCSREQRHGNLEVIHRTACRVARLSTSPHIFLVLLGRPHKVRTSSEHAVYLYKQNTIWLHKYPNHLQMFRLLKTTRSSLTNCLSLGQASRISIESHSVLYQLWSQKL